MELVWAQPPPIPYILGEMLTPVRIAKGGRRTGAVRIATALNARNIKLIGRIRKLDIHVIKLILSTVELNTKDIKLNVHGRKLIM